MGLIPASFSLSSVWRLNGSPAVAYLVTGRQPRPAEIEKPHFKITGLINWTYRESALRPAIGNLTGGGSTIIIQDCLPSVMEFRRKLFLKPTNSFLILMSFACKGLHWKNYWKEHGAESRITCILLELPVFITNNQEKSAGSYSWHQTEMTCLAQAFRIEPSLRNSYPVSSGL